MNDFIAQKSVWRTMGLMLICVAFVGVGLWLAGAFGAAPSSRRYSAEANIIIGWITVLFFGLCSLSAARIIFEKREQLRIGRSGVLWRRWSDEMVPWNEIEDVTIYTVKRQKFIVLHLRDPEVFPALGFLGKLESANRHMTGGDICITLQGTNRSFDEALDAISRFRPA